MTLEIKIRRFTDEGIDRFRGYLDSLRAGSTAPPPRELLTDSKTSCRIDGEGRVAQRNFETRLEMARYLDGALSGVEADDIENDVHLWSWLSLFFFDEVCPADTAGKRRPGRDYRHILEPGYPSGHRHLIGGTFLVYTVYGCGEDISRPLLCTPPHVENRFYHQFVARQSLITNRGVMEAACTLYFDPASGSMKRTAQARRRTPGTLYRFIEVIQQLDLNFDLYSMSGEEIIGLLPPEFDRWKGENGR